MRTYLMAGNWKMNKTIPETVVLTQQLCNQYNRKWDNVDIVLCPPAIDIKAAYTVLDFDKTNISLGAQNVHWEESGAFTGEISIPMIKDAGCEYCIVGHSERREMFNETDTTVNLKVKALVSAGIAPIVCVGESLAMRDSGDYVEFITAQVRAGLAGLDAIDMKNVQCACGGFLRHRAGVRRCKNQRGSEVLRSIGTPYRALRNHRRRSLLQRLQGN